MPPVVIKMNSINDPWAHCLWVSILYLNSGSDAWILVGKFLSLNFLIYTMEIIRVSVLAYATWDLEAGDQEFKTSMCYIKPALKQA